MSFKKCGFFQKAFTLVELLLVIIIVGVLASLAFPKLVAMVELSRGNEATNELWVIRMALERCALNNSGSYAGCTMDELAIADPDSNPGAHFTYTIDSLAADGFVITAKRNTVDNGDDASTIQLIQTSTGISRQGTGVYDSIQ